MKAFVKNCWVFLLICVMFFRFQGVGIAGGEESQILDLQVVYSQGVILARGTVKQGVHAVALMLYSGNELLRLQTAGVIQGAFDASIPVVLSAGDYVLETAPYEGGAVFSVPFTVKEESSDPETGEWFQEPKESFFAQVSGNPNLLVHVDRGAGVATVNLKTIMETASGPLVVTLPSIPQVDRYFVRMESTFLKRSEGPTVLLETEYGSVLIPCNMLSGIPAQGEVRIAVGKGDVAALPHSVQDAVGDRPVLSLGVTAGGEENPSAPVAVRVPYQASGEETDHPESIVVWSLGDSENVSVLPCGRYDPYNGVVTFRTTHFALFAVGFNKVEYSDVARDAWYHKAVSFIAARGITQGTSAVEFSPQDSLTRAQFLVLLMRAYGMEPDENPVSNFVDAGNAYYTGFLAAAKRLGIAKGVGEERFEPERAITRQEMFVFLHNTLDAIGQLPQSSSDRHLVDFVDAEELFVWAKDAAVVLVESGLIEGDGHALMPLELCTRAEAAQVLYNILTK